MTSAELQARALAEATAYTLFRGGAGQELGVRIIGVAPGCAAVKMRVRADMLDEHGMCQRRFIFSFADSAFAFASHTYNVQTANVGTSIEFLAQAGTGETLIAYATERACNGGLRAYDVVVTTCEGTCVAMFRGESQQTEGEVLPFLAQTEGQKLPHSQANKLGDKHATT